MTGGATGDSWADLAAWLDDAIAAANEDWRAWEGYKPATPRAAEAEALSRVRAKMDELE